MQGWCIVRRGRDLAPTITGMLKRSPAQGMTPAQNLQGGAIALLRDHISQRSLTSRLYAATTTSRLLRTINTAHSRNTPSSSSAAVGVRADTTQAVPASTSINNSEPPSPVGSTSHVPDATVEPMARDGGTSAGGPQNNSRRISPPLVAHVLGYAGLVPFMAGAAGCVYGVGVETEMALRMTQVYGASILSFLGAVHWGLALSHCGPGYGRSMSPILARDFIYSVVPSLAAWGAALAEPGMGLALLTPAFAGTLLYDLKRFSPSFNAVPEWYLPLRKKLTLGAVTSMIFAMCVTARRPVATVKLETATVVNV